MKRLWAGLLDRPHIREALGPARGRGAAHGVADPGAHRPAALDGRVLLTGDAAPPRT